MRYKHLLTFALFLLVSTLLIISLTSSVYAQNQSKVDNAYRFLENEVKKGWGTPEENSLAILALRNFDSALARQGADNLISNSQNGECWPKDGCEVKETAQALVALGELGRDTSKIENWLEDQQILAEQGGEWLLQLEVVPNGTCSISYIFSEEERVDTVLVNEDRTVMLDRPSFCFEDAGFWLRLKSACNEKEFLVTCSDGNYLVNLLLRTDNKLLVFPETKNTAATVLIKNKCFPSQPKGTKCDYDATQWASYALNLKQKELQTLAFLENEADANKPLSYAFMYLIKQDLDFANKLVKEQNRAGFWDTDRFFRTAISVLALDGSFQENVTKAEDWLLANQNSDFSWGTQKKRDTSAVLWGAFPRSGCGNNICESSLGETVTSCPADCRTSTQQFCDSYGYECCESVKVKSGAETFSDLFCPEGKVCAEDCEVGAEICTDGVDNDEDGRKDCADPDCLGNAKCESRELSCNDFFDNDGDALADCNDADCCTDNACIGKGTCIAEVEVCTDGIDNDNNGFIDCEDTACSSSDICKKTAPTWLWIVLIVLLVAIIAALFLIRRKKSGKGKGKIEIGFPPLGPPQAPTRPMPRPMPRPPPRIVRGRKRTKTEEELEEALKELEKI